MRPVVSVSLVGSPVPTRRQGHFIVLYDPIPITQGESLFSFFYIGDVVRSFLVGAFFVVDAVARQLLLFYK